MDNNSHIQSPVAPLFMNRRFTKQNSKKKELSIKLLNLSGERKREEEVFIDDQRKQVAIKSTLLDG